jgi:hypothetical protein
MEMKHKKLISRGVLTAVFLCMLLMIVFHYLLPQFSDTYPPPSEEERTIGGIIAIGIYLISALTGILIVIKDWKKN